MFAFVHLHKTGGTTIKSILRRSFGVHHFDDTPLAEWSRLTADDLRRIRRLYPRLKSIAGHRVRAFSDLREAAPDIRYFTFLRDPVRRTFSTFRARMADGLGLSGFPDTERQLRQSFLRMVEETANWQTRWLSDTDDAGRAIELVSERIEFVGLTERFDESLVLLRLWSGTDRLRIDYRPLNVSDQRLERDRWASAVPERLARIRRFLEQAADDAAMQSVVRAANREDLRLYEHVASVIYPAQQARWRDQLDGQLERFRIDQNASPPRHTDSWSGRAYRNLVVKPLLPWIVGRKPAAA